MKKTKQILLRLSFPIAILFSLIAWFPHYLWTGKCTPSVVDDWYENKFKNMSNDNIL